MVTSFNDRPRSPQVGLDLPEHVHPLSLGDGDTPGEDALGELLGIDVGLRCAAGRARLRAAGPSPLDLYSFASDSSVTPVAIIGLDVELSTWRM